MGVRSVVRIAPLACDGSGFDVGISVGLELGVGDELGIPEGLFVGASVGIDVGFITVEGTGPAPPRLRHWRE